MLFAMLNYITWTFRPDIFFIGNWEVRWYGLFFAIAFYVGLVMMTKMFAHEKVKPNWVDSLFVYIIVATVIGARLGHVFFYAWDMYKENPWDILKVWEGGLASHGGAIGIVLAVALYSRYVTHRNMLWTLDRLVVPVAFAAILIRTGNLTNHEIYGHTTDLPWGFRFIENIRAWQHGADPIFTDPSHPTQIYEALSYLATFLVLSFLYWKHATAKHREGLMLGVFLIGTFLSRFLIEFIKEDQEAFEATMTLNMGQWLSVPFVLAGIILCWWGLKRPPRYYDEPVSNTTPPKKAPAFESNVKGKKRS
jgi:phosphatidylglycerol---prolipoprotein diacylglyceryl transferase